MKKNFSIIILIALISLTSCTKEKDNNLNTNPLDGKWNLISRMCECPSINLNIGENVWVFKTSDNTLKITNNVESQYPELLKSGTYSIDITPKTIKVQSTTYTYYFKDNQLFLDSGIAFDSPLLTFKRDN